jgi:cobalt-zinc-cadmium efflux system protein
VGHHHKNATLEALGVAFFLNFGFAVVELAGGLWTGSFAILADALHDFGDSLALGLAWGLHRLAQKSATSTYTYGYKRFALLGGFVAGLVVVTGAIGIFAAAVTKLFSPAAEPPLSTGMALLALLGIAVNLFAAWRMHTKDFTTQVLRLHFFEDAASWILVLLGAVVIHFSSWVWVDPALALGLSVWIGISAIKSIRQGFSVFLQASPPRFDSKRFVEQVCRVPGVVAVHDLHAWSLDGDSDVVSLHVVVSKTLDDLSKIKGKIRELAGTAHVTVELEIEGEFCNVSCNTHTSG